MSTEALKVYREEIRKAFKEFCSNENLVYDIDTIKEKDFRNLLFNVDFTINDKRFLEKEFDIDFEKNLENEILRAPKDTFRRCVSFLKNDKLETTLKFVEATSIAIGFEPRPYNKFAKELRKGIIKVEKTKHFDSKFLPKKKPKISYKETKSVKVKNHSFSKLGLVLGSAIVIGILFWLIFSEKQNITIHNGDNNTVTINQIIPNKDTKFYDSNNNPKVWYGNNREGVPEFFTTAGNHPETGNVLKKVPLKLVARYKEGYSKKKKDTLEELTTTFTPVVSLYNDSIKKSSDIKTYTILASISDKWSPILTQKVKDLYGESKYISFFYTENFSSKLLKQTVVGDFSNLIEIKHYLDEVICTLGTASYSNSTLNTSRVVCKLTVTLKTYNTIKQHVTNEKTITTIGNGINKEKALINAIQKLSL